MDGSKAMTLSYADMVKKSLQIKPAIVPKSWFEQIDESEKQLMSRSNSMSTVLSDDTMTNYIRSNVKRHSISHSVDSGQISDMSSDNETCQKWHNVKDLEDELRKRKVKLAVHRRTSVDSCGTSSSTCCTDSNCSTDHNQLKLMCQQRWQSVKKMQKERETDEGVLARRQKQIDYGKNTIGYELYTKQVAIDQRAENHPKTPDMNQKYSRRAFDGLIKIWRKHLHKFDPDCSEMSDEQN
ncbi:histone RNA hairpin-binding protein-like [Sitodiplosis mosellana]|uniref:histone RNA hairpin-binding protein-like n=1 Tax=Sitodiplosis mosellana TaxID=263140 RepID=UPI00244401AC|nr:histone RNA hairpin-binding protein-like [Sitodiplosis mosellana]